MGSCFICYNKGGSRNFGWRGLTLFATPIIYQSIFQNEVVGVLYIDFCKAFDMVNHNLLLQKQKIYNVHEDAIAWFTSYLSDRKQCIKINN